MKKSLATALLSSIFALGMGTTAMAQEGGYGQPSNPAAQAQQQAPAADFSNSDLQKFASVQDQLDEIRGDYTDRVQSTDDPAKAADLQQEATQKMVEAVQNAGLEVDTYNQIAMAIQSNPDMRDRVQNMR
jgi:hypothetical protein